MDFDKILPLILIALWYIFKGGKKNQKKSVVQDMEERAEEFQQKASSQNKPPQSSKKPSSLQDILEELVGEDIPIPKTHFQTRKDRPKPKRYENPEPESLETLDPIIENQEKERAAKRAEMIKKYEEMSKSEAEDLDEEAFDLRQAIIHQTILERPYKD